MKDIVKLAIAYMVKHAYTPGMVAHVLNRSDLLITLAQFEQEDRDASTRTR